MNQHEAFWPLKKCMLYILCTLILSNPLCFIIGSSLTLIQNVIIHILIFFLMFRVSKRCHQDFNLLHIYHISYISYFCVKSGEKWFTCMCLHPHTRCGGTYLCKDAIGDSCKCVPVFVKLGMMIEKFRSPKFGDQKISIKL
jgi:hypothetical protein